MRVAGRLAVVGVVVGMAVAFADVLVIPVLADSRLSCQKSADWVSRNQDKLPSTLDGLAAFPPAYRAGIFSALTPEVRSAIIREKYVRFADSHRLTSEQASVVDLAVVLAGPSSYAASAADDRVLHERLTDLSRRITAAFPNESDRIIFSGITQAKPSYTWASWRLVLSERVRSLFAAEAFSPKCGCWNGGSTQQVQTECGGGSYTWECNDNCSDPKQNGCGVNGTDPCDGYCNSTF